MTTYETKLQDRENKYEILCVACLTIKMEKHSLRESEARRPNSSAAEIKEDEIVKFAC